MRVIVVATITLVLIAKNFVFSSAVVSYSDSAKVINQCSPYFPNDKKVFLSTDTIVPELMATLCGTDLRLLNDSFPVTHKADNLTYSIIRVERGSGDNWRVFSLGKFKHSSDIKTPCDLECAMELIRKSEK